MLSLKCPVTLALTLPFVLVACPVNAEGPARDAVRSGVNQHEPIAPGKSARRTVSPAATAHIEAVQAVAEPRGTRLDITLQGTFHLAWEGQGTHWQVRVSGAIPTAQLASGCRAAA